MTADRAAVGREAEALVARKLASQGFVVLGQNVRVGRLEIDVIARRGSLLVFCEVRARTSARIVEPYATIDRGKIARVRRAAAQWLSEASLLGTVNVRFDAASVVFDVPGGRIDYFEEAF